MDFNKLNLLFHTVKYLKPIQVRYRFWYFVKKRFWKNSRYKSLSRAIEPIRWNNFLNSSKSHLYKNQFIFLNQKHAFDEEIDWNFNENGKLWTYNLNYFDFLNQEDCSKENGLVLIKDYIKNDKVLKDGKEQYPISLRGINWIKFLSFHKVAHSEINETLYIHYQILKKNLEYHLLGNHLLENGFSLYFGAYFFKEIDFLAASRKILSAELEEQILNDGAHFELSPMYHQIILQRLLDCIALNKNNDWDEDDLKVLLEKKAIKMLSWLKTITYLNGDVPMVNDSAYEIAPKSEELFRYAKHLGLEFKEGELKNCGYRKFTKEKYELFVDVGNIGPDYQPGHAHSDTFSFELHYKKQPIIVDTGTSTYEKNHLRQSERRTSSHNTVALENEEQSQVWDGFRVAERARILKTIEQRDYVKASHDGYKKNGIVHTRSFKAECDKIVITDELEGKQKKEAYAYFHFHSSIKEIKVYKKKIVLTKEGLTIDLNGAIDTQLTNYSLANGFNKNEKGLKISVRFYQKLTSTIQL